jgi:hypothetical protein
MEHGRNGRPDSETDLESPFLREEPFGGETDDAALARLETLEAESPFPSAFHLHEDRQVPAVAAEELGGEAAEPGHEYDTPAENLPADAFVLDKDGKDYFDTFPQLGDLSVQKATVLTPAHFERLMDHLLASSRSNFVIDAHGDPAGLSMPLASGTTMSPTKKSLFMLRGIDHIQGLMRLTQESNTIWERASGTDLDRWQQIVNLMHSKTWQTMIGRGWPTQTPRISGVAAARTLVQSLLTALVNALFPGRASGKQAQVDTLIKKMLQLQAKGIREIQFRSCNIGKDPVTLYEFRKFLGADHLCAPDVRSGIGRVLPRIDREAVDRLAKRPSTQVYDLPGGRFAIFINIVAATFTAACAADSQAAVGEWVASHVMAHSRFRKGTLPVHFLKTQPLAFALDPDYAAHIQCRSSLWEGAVRAHELEEEQAHEGVEETEVPPAGTFEIADREVSDETETEDDAQRAWARALEQEAAEQEAALGAEPPSGEAWTGESAGYGGGQAASAPAFERDTGGGSTAVDPFPPHPYSLPLEMSNEKYTACAGAVERDPNTSPMCGAVADVTGNPELPPFYAHNPVDMLYVASLAKIYPMYVAFELRKRVQEQAKDMIKLGLSTASAGWEQQVFTALEKAWKAKLKAAFPTLPQDTPHFADIFVLSSTGDVKFAENDPPLTNADLDFRPPNPDPDRPPISPEFKTPPGKFRDWMRLMLRWSNNEAASNCIRALTYPYINGVLGAAGFFDKKSRTGLWLSGDYLNHDWLTADRAGQPLSPRWARLQRRKVTNFAGTAFQVARLMTLLAQERLVDKESSRDMMRIMTGVAGIGSYIRGALAGAAPPRPFSGIASKIGCGDEVPPPACGFTHDCAIVRVDRGGDPARTIRYVVVALGGHPNQAKADLRKMVVIFNDCAVARHP